MIVSAVALAIFIAAIQGLRPPEETHTYYAYFSDTSGLNRGADVRFGGSKVGRVTAISLDPEDQSRLRVEASVKADVPVNEASEAHITQTTLTAEMHLEISTGEKDSPPAEDGAVIPSEAGGLFDKAGELADSVKGILEDVGDLMGVEEAKEQEENGEGELVTVAAIFGDVDSAVKEGEGLVGDVREVLSERKGDIEAILTKVREAEDAVKELLADVNAVVTDNRGNIKGTLADVRGMVGRRQADHRARGRGLRAVGRDSRLAAGDAGQCRGSHRRGWRAGGGESPRDRGNRARSEGHGSVSEGFLAYNGRATAGCGPGQVARRPEITGDIMKRAGVAAWTVLVLAGCVSAPAIRYYTLDMRASGRVADAANVRVERLREVESLARKEILVQRSAHADRVLCGGSVGRGAGRIDRPRSSKRSWARSKRAWRRFGRPARFSISSRWTPPAGRTPPCGSSWPFTAKAKAGMTSRSQRKSMR